MLHWSISRLLRRISTVSDVNLTMAAAKKPGGRPKRPEALKKIYLRQSVHQQWRSKKDSLGYSKLSDSEFAEVLLQ